MKILAVLPRFPYPLEKGDKLRAYHQLRLLAREHDVYLFCTSHHKPAANHLDEVRRFCKDVQVVRRGKLQSLAGAVCSFLKGGSLQLGYWNSRRIRSSFATFEQRVQPDVIYCQMVRTMPWVKASSTRKVLDYQDALSMNTRRRAEVSKGLWRAMLKQEACRLEKAEREAFTLFDQCSIISSVDRQAITSHQTQGHSCTEQRHRPQIAIVPNGIDTDYFAPRDTVKTTDIVFCGNMHYEPNITAARYLVKSVMPVVWQRLPGTRVTIAGASPAPAVRRLAGPQVAVTGWVADIRSCYSAARLFAAPMLSGSGLQNKLLEAMSMGIACITTPIANAPLGAKAGEEIIVCQGEEETAEAIVRLLTDDALCQRIAAGGRTFVERTYSWEHSGIMELFNNI